MKPYHKYVFDVSKKELVGQFEQMYQAEESEGFDSWFERDLRELRKTITYTILNGYNFSNVLDIGCGKGAFTHLLKKKNNRIVAIDLSETAINKAKQSYPDIDFRCMSVDDLSTLGETFDLVIVMGTFAYIDNWPKVIEQIATMTHWFYVAEYIPPDPIGCIKSPDHLITEVEKHFVVETKIILDDTHCILLTKVKE